MWNFNASEVDLRMRSTALVPSSPLSARERAILRAHGTSPVRSPHNKRSPSASSSGKCKKSPKSPSASSSSGGKRKKSPKPSSSPNKKARRKVPAASTKRALTLQQKKAKRVTGASLNRIRHTYKWVHPDWPVVPALYLSDRRSPSTLRPVLLVKDPLNRYFVSPHGEGWQEIMPDRVSAQELRRLLELGPSDLPLCPHDPEREHLELVRMAEGQWKPCPLMYRGLRQERFNDSNLRRDTKVEQHLLAPVNRICEEAGLPPVAQYWGFHTPGKGLGYISERWGCDRSVAYTDDKLYMTAYAAFCRKYEKSPEGALPSKETPPGRFIRVDWTDDSNVATSEVAEEKQLVEWRAAVERRKMVMLRKGDSEVVRRQVARQMQEAGGEFAFDLPEATHLRMEKGKPGPGETGHGVRMHVHFYWPVPGACQDFDEVEESSWHKQEERQPGGTSSLERWAALTPAQRKEELTIVCFAHRRGLVARRYSPLGADLWRSRWEELPPAERAMYGQKQVCHISSMPHLSECMRDNLVMPLLDRATQEADLVKVVRYLAAWRELDRHMQGEMQWKSAWLKVQQHLGQVEARCGILRRRWGATPLGASATTAAASASC